jgi:outer membrane lipoprotein-sorting protein
MSELGDVLELMHGARNSFRTIRVVIRDWHHVALGAKAFERHLEVERRRGGQSSFATRAAGDEEPETYESVSSLWHERPARWRIEHSQTNDTTLTVVDGDSWWLYSPSMGAVTNDGDPGHSVGRAGEHLLDPSELIPAHDFEVLGRAEMAGRSCIVVRARPRPLDHGFHGAPPGADELELLVDAERGVLLRQAARIEGEEYHVSEVLEIEFDLDIEPETFRFQPPPGEQVRSARYPEPARVSIEEAARRAPFPVFIPTRVPLGSVMEVQFQPGLDRPPLSASVHISYSRPDARRSIVLNEMALPDPDPYAPGDWEAVDRNGVEIRVSDPSVMGGRPAIKVERDGTLILLHGDLDRDALIEIASSLAPAPTEPPPLTRG